MSQRSAMPVLLLFVAICFGAAALGVPYDLAMLGQYRLVERIGVGGMCEVWRATEPERYDFVRVPYTT